MDHHDARFRAAEARGALDLDMSLVEFTVLLRLAAQVHVGLRPRP